MALEDHLMPSEELRFSSQTDVGYGDGKYRVHLTTERLILHATRGLIRKNEDVLTWNLGNILRTEFKESGLLRKKGILRFETEHDTLVELEAGAKDMQTIYQNCMKFIQ